MAENASLHCNFLRVISLDSKLSERVFEDGVNVLCSYDPEGVIIKLVKGNFKIFFLINPDIILYLTFFCAFVRL